MDDLMVEIQQKTNDLNKAVKNLRKAGSEFAQAEHDYKILLRTEALRLRDSGMAVGMINIVVYGLEDVANARLTRDIKQATYEANQEAINSLKLQIRILDSQIQREWGQNG